MEGREAPQEPPGHHPEEQAVLPRGAMPDPAAVSCLSFPSYGSPLGTILGEWAGSGRSLAAPTSPCQLLWVRVCHEGHTVMVWVTRSPQNQSDGTAHPRRLGTQTLQNGSRIRPAYLFLFFSCSPAGGGGRDRDTSQAVLGALQVFYRWRKPQISCAKIALREGLVLELFRAVHGLRATHRARVPGLGRGPCSPSTPPSAPTRDPRETPRHERAGSEHPRPGEAGSVFSTSSAGTER